MKANYLVIVMSLLILQQKAAAQDIKKAGQATYKNPFSITLADPFVLYEEGTGYFMYGTGGGALKGFSAYSSKDLVNWKYEG